MKIIKKDNKILFDIRVLEKRSKLNVYALINSLYFKAKKIKENIIVSNTKLFNLLINENKKDNNNGLSIKKKIYQLNSLPNPTYLAIINLLKKK